MRQFLIFGISMIIMLPSCKTTKSSLNLSSEKKELYIIGAKILENSKTVIVSTNLNDDKRVLKILLNQLTYSDTVLIILSKMYSSKSSSMIGYSYFGSSCNSDINKTCLIQIQYGINGKDIQVNRIVNDYFEKEKNMLIVQNLFSKPKNEFIEYLDNLLENKILLENGGVSKQYIFLYKRNNNMLSYDIYSLTK